MFTIMLVVVFQSIFYLKIHQNNFFYFKKFIFEALKKIKYFLITKINLLFINNCARASSRRR